MNETEIKTEIARQLFEEFLPIAQMVQTAGIPPDFNIGGDYMDRWWLAKIEAEHDEIEDGPLRDHTRRTDDFNMYLHRVGRSDDDRAMHDHPWPNASLILVGRYREHTPVGVRDIGPGQIVVRDAEALHRLEVLDGPVWTLFLTGNKVREWGFKCGDRWVHSRDFFDKGCG